MSEWYIFIPACFALNLTFGPSNLLAMTHGAHHGVWFAQRAALARLLVFIPMIAASAFGLGVLLSASAMLFSLVKFGGALYLIWLGIKLWRNASAAEANDVGTGARSLPQAFKSEALVAISNPKAILIFAAFFPQFVSTDAYWQSYAFVGSSFLVLEACAILAYATFGRFAARFMADKLSWVQRGSGAMMCLFGVLLLLSPQPSRG